jgi:hypothetical protein
MDNRGWSDPNQMGNRPLKWKAGFTRDRPALEVQFPLGIERLVFDVPRYLTELIQLFRRKLEIHHPSRFSSVLDV